MYLGEYSCMVDDTHQGMFHLLILHIISKYEIAILWIRGNKTSPTLVNFLPRIFLLG